MMLPPKQAINAKQPNQENDWTLDTNVIIRANQFVKVPIQLIECIERNGYLCWSSAIAQEYQSRGAINLSQGYPPVPVRNLKSPTWFDLWLTKPGITSRISKPKMIKLTGAEKDKLRQGHFQDSGDFPFLELARSSRSHRLVTQEEDYNSQSIANIRRILGVRCLNYETALQECQT